MAVQDIFAPQSIEGPAETAQYMAQIEDYARSCEIRPWHGHPFIYSVALRQAMEATLTGARGVGCVITKIDGLGTGHDFIAKGQNRLADEDFEYRHVAHAEVLAIAEMNRKNLEKKQAGRMPDKPADVTLWSTLGPCPMCMIASVNQRIGNVVTIAPDWTGGVTMDYLSQTFPGFEKPIKKHGLKSFDAPIDLVQRPDVAQNLRRLCWAVSRIKNFAFNADEFYKNQDLLIHDALDSDSVTIDDLMKRLISAQRKHGIPDSDHRVASIKMLALNAFGSLTGTTPILAPLLEEEDAGKFEQRILAEFKALMILNLINQLEGEEKR